jgi:hypothetical protein
VGRLRIYAIHVAAAAVIAPVWQRFLSGTPSLSRRGTTPHFRSNIGLSSLRWYRTGVQTMSAMTYLWRHPKSGVYYFRGAVPDDLRTIIKTLVKGYPFISACRQADQSKACATALLSTKARYPMIF